MFVIAGSAGASAASNNQLYGDTAGDAERLSDTNYASDIRQVQITSQDTGAVSLLVTLVDAEERLVNGDKVDILVDLNRDGNADVELIATGNPGGQAAGFIICQLQPVQCGPVTGSDTRTGTSTHVVRFDTVTSGVAAFNFVVTVSYTQPGGTTTLTDRAPNSGVLGFEVRADADNDGVLGAADECPTQRARGVYDSNHNGCPGLFNFIKAFRRQVAVPFPGYLQLRRLSFEGPIPSGAKAVISGAGRRESRTTSRGAVRSSRFAGRLPYGARIVVRITKPGWIGFYAEYRVTRGGGLVAGRQACLPAVGAQKPTRCTTALRGK